MSHAHPFRGLRVLDLGQGVASPYPTQGQQRIVHFCQDGAGTRMKRCAFGGQPHMPGGAIKQPEPQLVFQRMLRCSSNGTRNSG